MNLKKVKIWSLFPRSSFCEIRFASEGRMKMITIVSILHMHICLRAGMVRWCEAARLINTVVIFYLPCITKLIAYD